MAVIVVINMNFWFKRKKIVLDCFTTDAFSYEYCKIESAVKYYPDWWLNLPSEEKNTNMKSCKGFTNLYVNSYVIPFWSTVDIEVSALDTRTFKWTVSGIFPEAAHTIGVIISHNPKQYGKFTGSGNYQHIKLLSSWSIRTKSKVKFFYSDPVWHRDDLNNYTVLPGILEFKYNRSTEANIMFEYKAEPYNIRLTPGMPIAMMTPLTEDDVELRHHLVTPNEMIYAESRFSFDKLNNMFNNKKKFLDDADKRTQTCPYKR